jgi:hypothetical protein
MVFAALDVFSVPSTVARLTRSEHRANRVRVAQLADQCSRAESSTGPYLPSTFTHGIRPLTTASSVTPGQASS